MQTNSGKKSIWWREPMVWLIMGLPLTAVVAGLTTVWIAYSHADKIVSDHDVEGIAVTHANEMDKRAHYLGLSAQVDVVSGHLTLQLDGRRLSDKPKHLVLRVIHQNNHDSDNLLVLQAGHDGSYGMVLPIMPAGPCKVILEPEDQKWRLTGLWQTPFDGQLQLTAKSISDSSMLP